MTLHSCSARDVVCRTVPAFLASWALAAAALLPLPSAARDLPDFVELVEKVGPAVVNIRTTERAAESDAPAATPGARSQPRRGAGSGFIVSADGYVITNAHVVDGATEVLVTLTDGREFKARLIGADERTDVALVKIDAAALPVLKIGDVGRLKVGEWVLAIGSPFGLQNTVTAGIVSAKQRETGSDVPFIQTDVAVNPGNSGGPLISIRGEVVGVNSQILSPVGSYIGISFAIPIDEAMRVADQLRTTGRVVRGYLGIGPVDVPRDLPDEYGLAKTPGRPKGALVRQVVPGTPAERAGVQPGDVVLAVDGHVVESAIDLRRTLGALKPDSTVTLKINRRGTPLDIRAGLAELKPQAAAEPPEPPPTGEARASDAAKPWGLAVADLNTTDRSGLRGVDGVKVTGADGSAEAAGLRAGDVIVGIAGAAVASVRQFEAAVARLEAGRSLPVAALRDGWVRFVRIPVSKATPQ